MKGIAFFITCLLAYSGMSQVQICRGEVVTRVATNYTSSIGFEQIYILVNDLTGEIVAFNSTGTFDSDDYSHILDGNTFSLYALNTNDTNLISALSIGILWSELETLAQTACANILGPAVYQIIQLLNVSAGPDESVCLGEEVTLNASFASGNLSWSNNVQNNVSFTPENAGTFEYVASVSENGCFVSDTVSVIVYELPVASILFEKDTICFGDSLKLTGSGGVNYTWSNGELTQAIDVAPTDRTVYQLTVEDEHGCYADTLIFISVVDQPSVNITTVGPLLLCVDDTVTLSAVGNGLLTWPDGSSGNTFVADGSMSAVYVSVTSLCGNTATDSVVIDQGVIPYVDAGVDGTVDVNEPYYIDATVENEYSFEWLPDNGMLGCSICEDPVAIVDTTTMFYLSAISADGCEVNDSVLVTVEPNSELTVWWPNVISGDGENCCFGIKVNQELTNFEMRIFNRWGELVFITNDQNELWSGTFRGQDVGQGVFTFIVVYNYLGQSDQIAGNVTVLR